MKTAHCFWMILKNLALVAVLVLGGVVQVVGQQDKVRYDMGDTVRANRLLKEVYKLWNERRYDEALPKVDTAGKIFLAVFGEYNRKYGMVLYRTAYLYQMQLQLDTAVFLYHKSILIQDSTFGAKHPVVATSYNNLGICFSMKGDFDQAIEAHLKALSIRRDAFGELHTEVAASYNNLGICNDQKGEYDQAIYYYKKSYDIRSRIDRSGLAEPMNNLGNTYSNKGWYDQAIEWYSRSLELDLKNFGHGDPRVAQSYNNLGVAFLFKDDYDRAVDNFNKSLYIRLATFGEMHPDVAEAYNNLGNCYASKGEYYRAIELYDRAIAILIETMGEEHYFLSQSFHSLGNCYFEMNNYDRAIEYYNKSLNIRLNVLGPKHTEVAGSYNNLSLSYFDKGEHQKGIDYLEKAVSIDTMIFGLKHPSVADEYNNLGYYYFEMDDYNKSFVYYEKSLNIKEEVFDSIHSSIAGAYRNFGNLYSKKGDLDQALVFYQKSLTANAYDKGLDSVLSYEQVLETHEEIGRLHLKKPKNKGLSLASSTFHEAREAIRCYRQSLARSGSKLRVANKFLPVYEGSITADLALYGETGDTSYLHEAFESSELGKSIVLYEAIKARQFAGISDDSLEVERQLQVDIAYYERKRLEEETKPITEKKDSLVAYWGAKVFEKRQQLDSLLADFDKKYPEYKRLKYGLSTVSLAEIQDTTFLSPHQTLIEYFLGDSALYIFAVNRNNLKAVRVDKDSLEQMVQDYLSVCKSESKFYEGNRYLPWRLYQKLFLPVQDMLDSSLIIIPDGILADLPFETLVETKPANNKPADYSFLVWKYSISYCYSATLWKEMREKKHRKDAGRTWLGYAPFANESSLASKRGNSQPLARSIGNEVVEIPNILGYGQAIIGIKAMKDTFCQTAGNANIVHISSHGILNPIAEEYTYIAFPHKIDSIDHDSLFIRELYNVPLNADLVVLGTCVSGTGKLARGEGVISLARACAYAGAKSIVTSLYEVNDLATAEMMRAFYRNLKNDMAKDEALRQAKLQILSNYDAHPYYWAGFIGVGDMGKPILK